MISTVYSYYMSQYGNKTSSKYDSAKKSDSRNVYNNIMLSNSHAPVCKIDMSADSQKFAIDIKENALVLSNMLDELEDANDTLSFKKMAYTSNPDAVDAEFIGDNSREYGKIDIVIDSLAKGQTNTGNYLNPNARSLAPGKYSFDVDVASVTYEFQFNVSSSNTNLDIQNKLARLMNGSNIGLQARVDYDSSGNSALVISSTSTGLIDDSDELFSIYDNNSANSGSVGILGLNNTTTDASDAVFTVNGENKTSSTNTFNLGGIFNITLKAVPDEPVVLGLKADNESVIDNIKNIVSGYNSIIDLSENKTANSNSTRKLYNDFVRVAKAYRNTLESNGISLDNNGKLSINSTVMSDRAISDSLRELKKFKGALKSRVDNAVIDPLSYANRIVVAYKNPAANTTTNPYAASAYAGMLFDGYL